MWGSFIVSAKPQGLGKQLENMKKYIERNIQ